MDDILREGVNLDAFNRVSELGSCFINSININTNIKISFHF